MTLTSHQQRILTALVLLPLTVWMVFQNDTVLATGLFVIAGLGLYEYCSMFWQGRQKFLYLLLGLVPGALIAWSPLAALHAPTTMPVIFLILAGFFLLASGRASSQTSFTDITLLLAGVLYLPLMLQLFRLLSPIEMMLILIASFATDTGGFYAGSWWGTKKLWPQISPKKTWAGSCGGMGLTVLCTLFTGLIWGLASCWAFILLGIILNIAAQFGDFFESALKRWAGVKDSGQMLPGHGGILDRIDSILFVLPVYVLLRDITTWF